MKSDNALEVLISPASYWEIAIKISLGKFVLNARYEEFWQRTTADNGFKILPILVPHTAVLTTLPFHHKDPFDRLLIAQAIVEDLDLMSADSQLDPYPIRRIW